ncbi:MAG: aldolase catalytic domain-containing protein [Pseudomonas sp.]|nr:aldolase catalytic domain-containing protein [Pseudomonas sp.]
MTSNAFANTQFSEVHFLDCTLRDGGYYNAWDFSPELVQSYIKAMESAGVDTIELGLRSLNTRGFKGPHAYTTDNFLNDLDIPDTLIIGVMINASDLLGDLEITEVLATLFPAPAWKSHVSLVRIACHFHEFEAALSAVAWLKERGFRVGFNLMQIADRDEGEITTLALAASSYPIDVLYFADSMGSMTPTQTALIIRWLRKQWSGPLGIHTHDNLGLALANTLEAISAGVTWVDATVTGMGRGPGNAKTEELAIEIAALRGSSIDLVPLMTLVRKTFKPMQQKCGWGTNPYYYLTGKYGIHPSYIQQMLSDPRYDEEDILAVIDYLRSEGGKKFSLDTLDLARAFYHGPATGSWRPADLISGREVLLLGSGPGAHAHRHAIESYISRKNPLVVALNTQTAIPAHRISLRIACHPVRLLSDAPLHELLPHPLILPEAMLPEEVSEAFGGQNTLNFGLEVRSGSFEFNETTCCAPNSLVFAYALAVLASGKASRILLAGFDGYGADDPRNVESRDLLSLYQSTPGSVPVIAVTPSSYGVAVHSIYAM